MELSICRTCLSCESLQPIFLYYDDDQRIKLLSLITGVKIEQGDGLPQQICNQCIQLIDSAIKLRKQSVYAQKILMSHQKQDDTNTKLNSGNIKIEIELKVDHLKGNKLSQNKYITENIDVGNTVEEITDSYDLEHLLDEKTCDLINKSHPSATLTTDDDTDTELPIVKEEITTPNDDLNEIYSILDSLVKKPLSRDIKLDKSLTRIYDILDSMSAGSTKKVVTKKVIKKKVQSQIKKRKPDKEKTKMLWSLAVQPIVKKKPVQCSVCFKTVTYSGFPQHAALHLDPKYNCEICGQKLRSKHGLRSHLQRRHGEEKQHCCTHCEHKCCSAVELRNHVRRVHTGERPYSCDVCSRGFHQRKNLSIHMKTHSDVKRFQCDRCSHMFVTRAQLYSHCDRTHLMRYTYLCYLCEHRASSTGKVKDHLTKVHGVARSEQRVIQWQKETRRDESAEEASIRRRYRYRQRITDC